MLTSFRDLIDSISSVLRPLDDLILLPMLELLAATLASIKLFYGYSIGPLEPSSQNFLDEPALSHRIRPQDTFEHVPGFF